MKPNSPQRKALIFFASLLGAYVFFMIPWPGVETGFGAAFAYLADEATGGNRVIPGTNALVRVRHDPEHDPTRDIRLILGNLQALDNPKGATYTRTSSRQLGYMPVAVFLAFVLASPVGWARKGWAALCGLPIVFVFVATRFAVLLLFQFNGAAPHCLFQLGPFGSKTLLIAYDLLAVEPATAYVVPVFIWMAVTFRRSDFESLAKLAASPKETTGSEF
jgi:hypothetical protein